MVASGRVRASNKLPRPWPRNELEYLTKHPGGFDRQALEDFLPRAIGEWVEQRGLKQPDEVIVNLILKSGEQLAITGARAAVTWIVFFTEDDTARFVPYTEIVGIEVRRRDGPKPKTPVGFSIERLDTEEAVAT